MDPALAAILAAIAAPLTAFFIAVRRFSGKIESSDAKELWEESRAIRDWALERIKSLSDDVDRLEQRVRSLESENTRLHVETETLIAQLEISRNRITELERTNGHH